MKYLYGDSTPFPLGENFLATARAATKASVTLLLADELAAKTRQRAAEAEQQVRQELARLDQLRTRLWSTFGGGARELSNTPCAVVGAKITELSQGILEEARAEILEWRTSTLLEIKKSDPQGQVFTALNGFLVTHCLPETTWNLRWRAAVSGAQPRAEIYATTPYGLDATFDVRVPPNHMWSRAVRVGNLQKDITVRLTQKTLLGKERVELERLDGMYITRVDHLPDRASMTLRRSPHDASQGIEILVRNGETATEVTATRIGKDGVALGTSEALRAEDVAAIHRLWVRIESTIAELVAHRSQITSATLRGMSMGDIDHPRAIAELIVQAVAPVVREIARRSSAGELTLKRSLGDGRREEIFISHAELLAGVDTLSPPNREIFDAFDISHTGRRAKVIALLPAPANQQRRAASA